MRFFPVKGKNPVLDIVKKKYKYFIYKVLVAAPICGRQIENVGLYPFEKFYTPYHETVSNINYHLSCINKR